MSGSTGAADPRERPETDVVAGVLIAADGRVLFGRRPGGKVYAGYWELPGGKVERGETLADALIRELHEELGIEAARLEPWIVRTHVYAHARVRLHFFRVTEWRGDPHGRENQDLAWQAPTAPMLAPMLPANGPVLAALSLPDRYAVSQADVLGRERFLRALDAALDGGIALVLVREPGWPAERLAALASEVVSRSRGRGARVLVHADAEIARRVGADGVHYPARCLAALSERPADLLCAASCHDRAELERAARLELDFAVVGPVLPTPSHPGAPTLGWDGLARLLADLPLPVYAIGGMRGADVVRARACGAQGVAMLRGAWTA
jgi:8-oxo-dGTP diphosphatase